MAKRTSVFDRLSDVSTFTGVYAERFKGDGRINSDTDLSIKSRNVTGSTNNGSDVIIRDISEIMRPNLRMASKAGKKKRGEQRQQGKGLDVDAQLRHIFQYYCQFGRTSGSKEDVDTIDNVNFAKFARECPTLIDRVLTRTEVDLIFTKAKPKFARRLDYSHFLDALSALAAKKYADADPTTAFTLLLAHHVLKCPAAPGRERAQQQQQQRAPPRPAHPHRLHGRAHEPAGAAQAAWPPAVRAVRARARTEGTDPWRAPLASQGAR